MLIHNLSAATTRISDTCKIGRILSARVRTASMASTAYRRGNRYSDCSSSPLLGVKPMRKWGKRSAQEPALPNCGVQELASSPMIGCRSTAAATAPEVILYLLGLISDPALDPDLIDFLTPASKDADAVAARDDLVEVLEEGLPA